MIRSECRSGSEVIHTAADGVGRTFQSYLTQTGSKITAVKIRQVQRQQQNSSQQLLAGNPRLVHQTGLTGGGLLIHVKTCIWTCWKSSESKKKRLNFATLSSAWVSRRCFSAGGSTAQPCVCVCVQIWVCVCVYRYSYTQRGLTDTPRVFTQY